MVLLFIILGMTNPVFAQDSFFYQGDGYISIVNQHTKKKFSGSFRDREGNFISQKQINEVFQIPKDFGEDFSLRTLHFLDYLEDEFAKGKTVSIVSAYRSPAYNEKLRKKGALAGKTSYHIDAMAADVIFPGGNPKEIWEFATKLNYGGVGYYKGNSIHVDSGKPRSWTEETAIDPKEGPPLNKNIYISIEKDFYKPGQIARFFFSGISNYPFAVKKTAQVMDSKNKVADIQLDIKNAKPQNDDCVLLTDREKSRNLYWTIPTDFSTLDQRLHVQVTFCDPMYEQPKNISSREFSVRNL